MVSLLRITASRRAVVQQAHTPALFQARHWESPRCVWPVRCDRPSRSSLDQVLPCVPGFSGSERRHEARVTIPPSASVQLARPRRLRAWSCARAGFLAVTVLYYCGVWSGNEQPAEGPRALTGRGCVDAIHASKSYVQGMLTAWFAGGKC